jgi:hypothetical protein
VPVDATCNGGQRVVASVVGDGRGVTRVNSTIVGAS